MSYNHVISVHCFVCACVAVCLCGSVCVCFWPFLFDPYCYRLDCSHPPIHPIATIATDGAAGINAPGSASLINGRLISLIADFFMLWLLSSRTFTLPLPPAIGALCFVSCAGPFCAILSMCVLFSCRDSFACLVCQVSLVKFLYYYTSTIILLYYVLFFFLSTTSVLINFLMCEKSYSRVISFS